MLGEEVTVFIPDVCILLVLIEHWTLPISLLFLQ